MPKKTYQFNPEVAKHIKSFKDRLLASGLNQNTARQHGNYVGLFLEWLEEQGIEKEEVAYQTVITFIRILQDQGYPTRLTNRIVLAIRHYYQYLKIGHNPAAGIYLRGRQMSLPNIVDYEEICSVYNNYQGLDPRTKRNRIMLGLMVHQAITTSELKKLEPSHIQLEQGKIYIPGSRQSNARILPLEVKQLLELQEYLTVIRPQMQANITKDRSGRKPNQINWEAVKHQLFFSENGSGSIKESLLHLFRHLRKINPEIKSNRVIRLSVITYWLKSEGLRQVQYKAGHRYVSSTERYQSYHLEELSKALSLFHPLK